MIARLFFRVLLQTAAPSPAPELPVVPVVPVNPTVIVVEDVIGTPEDPTNADVLNSADQHSGELVQTLISSFFLPELDRVFHLRDAVAELSRR